MYISWPPVSFLGLCPIKEGVLDKVELDRVESYLKRTFGAKTLNLRPQPKKTDMAEVFLGDEFIATLYREEEDGEISYQFQMAILDMDLD